MKIEFVSSLLVMPLYWLCLCNHVFVVSGLCLDDQRILLLQFKKNLTFIDMADRSSSRLKWWNASDDCCRWMGVTCDNEGHVTALDLSGESISGGFDDSSVVFSLQHLQKLNLAANNFMSVIPSGFNKLEKLTYLNLSYAGFVGQIPIEISQLTRLVTLHISSLSFLTRHELKLENPNLQKLVQNLTSIRQLYLDGVNISVPGHEWCSSLLTLNDLQELSMSGCNLSGPLDSFLATLENLSVIVLDENDLSSPVPQTFSHFKNLTVLSLVNCGLTGTFPQKIFNIGTLKVIDISYNSNLHGLFPEFPLSGSLQTFRVSNTIFSGSFPNSIGNMRNLSELDFSFCGFNGTLPNSLSNFTELSYVDLKSNKFTGQMPSFNMAKKLTHLDLSQNGLDNLVSIDLGYNSFTGRIPSSLIALPSLQHIRLSHNQFSQLDDFINVTSSILKLLDLSSNNLSGNFPTFIFLLSKLSVLQLSSNKFSGSMQLNKLLEFRYLTTLDLSYNNLSVNVNVTNGNPSSFTNISILNLASCNMKIFPGFLRNHSKLAFLDLSDNKIQGIVPNWIWKLQNPQSLNISHNLLTHLEGPLQNLSSSFETLGVLNMRKNNLTGHIPDMFSATCALRTLDLHHNKLDGKIPKSVSNCTTLEVLDLGENKITDVFPCLLKNISTLRVLVLRKNNFYGHIGCPKTNGTWHILQIVDIAINNFSGKIPRNCFTSWEAMMSDGNQAESNDSVTITIKGQRMDLVKILTVFTSIDFSNNHFEGEIPKELSRAAATTKMWKTSLHNRLEFYYCRSGIGFWPCYYFWSTLYLETMEGMVLANCAPNSLLDLPSYDSRI
ncbi:Receptor-like protein 12, partial [Mucuna pruriens]